MSFCLFFSTLLGTENWNLIYDMFIWCRWSALSRWVHCSKYEVSFNLCCLVFVYAPFYSYFFTFSLNFFSFLQCYFFALSCWYMCIIVTIPSLQLQKLRIHVGFIVWKGSRTPYSLFSSPCIHPIMAIICPYVHHTWLANKLNLQSTRNLILRSDIGFVKVIAMSKLRTGFGFWIGIINDNDWNFWKWITYVTRKSLTCDLTEGPLPPHHSWIVCIQGKECHGYGQMQSK